MPECSNCGAFVSAAYARVFVPTGQDPSTVDCCPNCEDMMRDNGVPREYAIPQGGRD